MEKMDTRGLPEGACRNAPTSSGAPSVQAEKPGEASRLFSATTSAKRSLAG